MKARIILVISMFILSIAMCLFSMLFVRNTMDNLDHNRIRVVMYVEQGHREEGDALLTSMLTYVSARQALLEILTPHDDLHEMVTQLTDARVSLSINDMDDFKQAIMLFQEYVEHIRTHEALTLSNIL